jgi:putative endonuclease
MGDDGRQETGEWGEQQAEKHLRKAAGMRVLARRWRPERGHGELDLVMQQGEIMVFVEVRVRTGGGDPLATYRSIGRGKWRSLRRTALAFLRQSQWRPQAVRFDVVGVRRTVGGQLIDVTHWENVGVFGRNFRF